MMRKFKKYILVMIILSIPVYGADTDDNTFLKSQQELEASPYYHYPYDGLHLILESEGVETIKIFSYGSLMDTESASRTLSHETLSTLKPAVAFGVKRVFNRDVAIKANSKWGIPINDNARGMLNLSLSDNDHDMVNGVVFEMDRKEIPNLLYRETGYDLIPVIVKDWEYATTKGDSKYYIAYTFYAPPESSYTNSYIDPRPNYYELSKNAANQYGPVFYHLWFNTTYLSDGVTPIGEWEELVQEKDALTQTEQN